MLSHYDFLILRNTILSYRNNLRPTFHENDLHVVFPLPDIHVCLPSQFKCTHPSRCIPGIFRCNGQDNCGEGEDEKDCRECPSSNLIPCLHFGGPALPHPVRIFTFTLCSDFFLNTFPEI